MRCARLFGMVFLNDATASTSAWRARPLEKVRLLLADPRGLIIIYPVSAPRGHSFVQPSVQHLHFAVAVCTLALNHTPGHARHVGP